MQVYVFYRDDMFYMLDLADDTDAVANAECNPGTRRVENIWTGETVWPEKPKSVN